MVEVGNIITLSNNKDYTVVTSKVIDGYEYVYLIDNADMSEIMFCKFLDSESLEEVADEELINKLFEVFGKEFLDK